MPKTVAQLRPREKCIYQAFAHITDDSETVLGQYVNGRNLDADDTRAVVALAGRYGLGYVDALNGLDFTSGFAGLDKNRDVIAVITRERTIVQKIRPISTAPDPKKHTLVLSEARAQAIFEESPDSVTWHAVFGSTDAGGTVTWHDAQNLFPNGPTDNAVAVCFSRNRA